MNISSASTGDVLGALPVGSEYTTGLIRHTFSITPIRSRLVTAKLSAVALVALAIGVAAVALVGVVAAIAVAGTGRDTGAVFNGSGVRLMIGSVLVPVFYATVAAALSFVWRSTAGGIIGSVAVLVLGSIMGWLGS